MRTRFDTDSVGTLDAPLHIRLTTEERERVRSHAARLQAKWKGRRITISDAARDLLLAGLADRERGR
jgi:hypothetical protein